MQKKSTQLFCIDCVWLSLLFRLCCSEYVTTNLFGLELYLTFLLSFSAASTSTALTAVSEFEMTVASGGNHAESEKTGLHTVLLMHCQLVRAPGRALTHAYVQ